MGCRSYSNVPRFAVLVFVGLGGLIITETHGCYLQNCPLGKRVKTQILAKRETPNQESQIRMCSRCGPYNRGQCVGPNICCLPEQGCLMGVGLQGTVACKMEIFKMDPCMPRGKSCTLTVQKFPENSREEEVVDGICTSRGVCCTDAWNEKSTRHSPVGIKPQMDYSTPGQTMQQYAYPHAR